MACSLACLVNVRACARKCSSSAFSMIKKERENKMKYETAGLDRSSRVLRNAELVCVVIKIKYRRARTGATRAMGLQKYNGKKKCGNKFIY